MNIFPQIWQNDPKKTNPEKNKFKNKYLDLKKKNLRKTKKKKMSKY